MSTEHQTPIIPTGLIRAGETSRILETSRTYLDELVRKGVLTRLRTQFGYLYERAQVERLAAERAEKRARKEPRPDATERDRD
jgi:hypothetical protein